MTVRDQILIFHEVPDELTVAGLFLISLTVIGTGSWRVYRARAAARVSRHCAAAPLSVSSG